MKEQLKRLAEQKATMLIAGRDINQIEKEAYELCWTNKEKGQYNQNEYDEYYNYYETCIDTLENGGKLKADKIDKILTVKQRGSMTVGACSFETPYLFLEDEKGNKYSWISNTVEQKGFLNYDYDKLHVIAYIKPVTGHLYKVKAEKIN